MRLLRTEAENLYGIHSLWIIWIFIKLINFYTEFIIVGNFPDVLSYFYQIYNYVYQIYNI